MLGCPTDCPGVLKTDFLGQHNKCSTLHDGTAHETLNFDTTSSDLDHVSSSQQCQTVLTENVTFLSDYLEAL